MYRIIKFYEYTKVEANSILYDTSYFYVSFTFLMHIKPTACFSRNNSLNSSETHDPTLTSRILLTLDFIG